jgi:hypothetical protein
MAEHHREIGGAIMMKVVDSPAEEESLRRTFSVRGADFPDLAQRRRLSMGRGEVRLDRLENQVERHRIFTRYARELRLATSSACIGVMVHPRGLQ